MCPDYLIEHGWKELNLNMATNLVNNQTQAITLVTASIATPGF